jgi:hypothetical protein
MKHYDSEKIGKLISAGSEHIIFNYGDNKVIKFSIINFLIGKDMGIARETSELSLCKKYFKEYVLDTEILSSKNHRFIAEVQPKIKQQYLNIEDMNQPLIRNQFIEIIQIYNQLISDEKNEVDLTGQAGLFGKRLSNIFITDDKKLVIMDATLLKATGPIWLKISLIIIRSIILPIQKHRISQFTNQPNL